MKSIWVAALGLALAGAACAKGEGYVPAHRTRDGTRVPPNVSTISGHAQPRQLVPKTHLASTAGEAAVPSAYQIPLFVNARPLR